MKIEITRIGNRTTCHRTATGAARNLLKMSRDGNWRQIAIVINGVTLDNMDAINLLVDADDANANRLWKCPVKVMAEKIAAHA